MSHLRLVRRLRGIALIMSLFMCLIVVAVVTLLISWVQYDNNFATVSQMQMRAYYLAQSGLDWYTVNSGLLLPPPRSTTIVVSSTTDSFTVSMDGSGNLTSVGTVSLGNRTYNRALYVPQGPSGSPGLQFPDIRDEGGQ